MLAEHLENQDDHDHDEDQKNESEHAGFEVVHCKVAKSAYDHDQLCTNKRNEP